MRAIDKWHLAKTAAVKMNRRSEKKKEVKLKLLSKYGTFLHGFLCLVVTFYLVGLTLIHYLQNEDTSVVSDKKFNLTPDDLYPTYTICFVDKRAVNQRMLEHDGIYQNWYILEKKGIKWPQKWVKNTKPWIKYRSFLKGKKYITKGGKNQEKKERQMMSEIDFVKATKPLSRIMKSFEFSETFEHDSSKHKGKKIKKSKVTIIRGDYANRSSFESVFSLSHTSPNQLCFTRKSVTISGYKKAYEKILLMNTLYTSHFSDIYLYVHHPGQFWKKNTEALRLDMLDYFSTRLDNIAHGIEITQVQTMRKRADANEPCDSELDTNYDKYRIKGLVDFLKCIPPFWKPYYEWKNSTFAICKTSEKLLLASKLEKDVALQSDIMERFQQPCAEMSFGIVKSQFKMKYDFSKNHLRESQAQKIHEKDAQNVLVLGRGHLSIEIKYPDHRYHEIVNMQLVSFDSFWSSTGGFIGMFLGYSVMQVPHFIFGIIEWSIKRNN